MSELFPKIKEITEPDNIAGYEHSVRSYLYPKITPLVDDVQTDGLGGIFGIKNSAVENAPRIMVAAHMDGAGFMTNDIKADGTVRTIGIGGWDSSVLSSQRFTFRIRNGRAIPAVSGSVPPHFLRGVNDSAALPKIGDIIFDAGFTDRAEAEPFSILPGDIIVLKFEITLTANQENVISKAWDNRFDVLMVTESLESLKGQEFNNTLTAGASVQEEVGLRGAHVSATGLRPELFFAADYSPAGDIYGNQGKIGDGTLFRFYDPGHIMLKDTRDLLLTTVEEAGIKYQYHATKGGTDAGTAHLKNGGIPSTTIGVYVRYIRSHQSFYAMDDLLQMQVLLQAIVKRLDRSTVDLIKKY